MTRNVDQLRSIQTFEQLIPFLEQDLDWPFPDGRDYEFDDLTFEYTPDELGLESDYAAKIKRIHQLRPLVTGQPWGIFFVEFENKKLPIVVLRRILSHLVLKQRKSANPADRARWNAGDLLFISAFAEEGTSQREIAFAHFHQDPGDQPTLRVLGWDGGDTPLKLEHVSQLLRQRLSWPRNPGDHAAWRKQWAGAFRYKIGEQIRTADLLARELARVARNIRDAAMALMKVESAKGPLRRMHEAFRTALIHDLTQEGFADTYAQTITYGLLTAAISRTDRSAGADGTFVLAEDIHNMVPITNPFLKEMLESFLKVGGRGTSKQPGLDFDELGVQEVVEMLRSSDINLPAVLEDFGNRNPGEDPVIRFYEDFLKAYNKELKIKRGVFYTPQPVVSYIVRSVHELLQTEFGLPDGLASTITWGEMAAQMAAAGKPFIIPGGTLPESHFVIILDPATGTATFLVEVIDVVFRTLTKQWKADRLTAEQQQEEWNRYVPVHLLPRLFGYELMMAPYAIAHMKMGLKLGETGYKFTSEERVRVYLTNALEPAHDFSDRLAFDIPALAHESTAVNLIKERQRFTVIIGNPPYSFTSQNLTPTLRAIVEPYRFARGVAVKEKGALQAEKAIQDDYIKFMRLAEQHLLRVDLGILGFITSHGYLDNPTLRGMRSSYLGSFDTLAILDLHGNTTRGEYSPDGVDVNVFDIKQGVSILLAKRSKPHLDEAVVRHADLWGSRESKYAHLGVTTTSSETWAQLLPDQPQYFFIRYGDELGAEYSRFDSLTDIFPLYGIGAFTSKDHFAISFTAEQLVRNAREFQASNETNEALCERLEIGMKDAWNVTKAREALRKESDLSSFVRPILYRPFDSRLIFYHQSLVWSMSKPTLKHMAKEGNIALAVGRSGSAIGPGTWDIAFCTESLTDLNLYRRGGNSVFPLFLIAENGAQQTLEPEGSGRLNLSSSFVDALAHTLNLSRDSNGFIEGIAPRTLFNYFYALLYSPMYRVRYAGFLSVQFPRLPRPKCISAFHALADLGRTLTELHTLKLPARPSQSLAIYVDGAAPMVDKVSYRNGMVWLNKKCTSGFGPVPEEIWQFHVGGYQVCEKWLKDRKGMTLSDQDIYTYRRVVTAISETIRLMAEIDEVIAAHGGWPGAFA